MTAATHESPSPVQRAWDALRPRSRLLWTLIPVLIAAILYLSTVQTIINGGNHPYVTDVGEHQNALPRWGTIHHSSYPLWTFLGSLFSTVLGWLGVSPATAVSLYALVWGLATLALLVIFMMELGIAGPWAALGGLVAAVSTSVWMNASIGELHTATMAVSLAVLLMALRYGRSGRRSDLLWLVFLFSQGVMHQRSVLFLAPAALLLVWPHLLDIFRMGWRTWLLMIGLALLGPLTYLYLPFRVWTGADWVFGSPGTWDGFWALVFFNNAALVVQVEQTAADWLERGRVVVGLLRDDLWLPLVAVGLVGVLLPPAADRREAWRIALALTSVWVLNLALTMLIWEGRVSDAQLAAKLPVLLMAAVGLALILDRLWRRVPAGAIAAALLLVGLLAYRGWQQRPVILAVTRDDSSQVIVRALAPVQPAADGRPSTVIVPWGTLYWTLTYAQKYEGKVPGLRLVDHNARPQDIIARGDRLLIPDQTFYVFPPSYYAERLGPLYLSTAAPGVFELSTAPINDAAALAADSAIYPAMLDLDNGVRIWGVVSERAADDTVVLTVYWQAVGPIEHDYSVAVHLLAQDPPQSGADLLDTDDKANPVGNWYPTTTWRPDEIVRDQYVLTIPPGTAPVGVRLGMYRSDPAGGFINTPWLSLPLPE